MYYVYVVNIERNDLAAEAAHALNSAAQPNTIHANPFELEPAATDPFDDMLLTPAQWTIGRRYDDFFALEERLRDFHGNSVRLGLLPDRKVFKTKNRSFLDAHRPFFERFLQTLLQQAALKRSDLLYSFLSTEDEIGDEGGNGGALMPDLNPIRAIRRVPNKLARERGQSLKPFILNVLANILAPRSTLYTSASAGGGQRTGDQVAETGGCSPITGRKGGALVEEDQGSVTSFTGASFSHHHPPLIHQSSRIALDNVPIQILKGGMLNASAKVGNEDVGLGEDKSPQLIPTHLNSIYDMLLFLLLRLAKLAAWLEALLVVGKSLFVDLLVSRWIRQYIHGLLYGKILTERMASYVVHALEEVVFDPQNAGNSSDEERRLRADLVLHCLDEAVEDGLPHFLIQLMGGQKNLRSQLRSLFLAFQLPRLNKQLVFVLLDKVIEKKLPVQLKGVGQ